MLRIIILTLLVTTGILSASEFENKYLRCTLAKEKNDNSKGLIDISLRKAKALELYNLEVVVTETSISFPYSTEAVFYGFKYSHSEKGYDVYTGSILDNAAAFHKVKNTISVQELRGRENETKTLRMRIFQCNTRDKTMAERMKEIEKKWF